MDYYKAKYLDSNFFPLPGFSLHFAANLQLKSHAYGVMTVSNIYSHYAESILSKKTEFLFKTHKSSLASHYTFDDKTPLIIINVHVINFKNASVSNSFSPFDLRIELSDVFKNIFVLTPGISKGY